MNHRIYIVLLITILIGIQPVFAQEAGGTMGTEPPVVPYRIRNNSYFQASQRYYKLAEGAYDFGDYDSSTNYAQEAIRYARLSDEYVALQMKIKEANDAIAAAKSRIDWATSSGASKQYPSEFRDAESWYGKSISARSAEEWDSAIDAAHRVVELLAYIGAAPAKTEAPVDRTDTDTGTDFLPATYTVRTWASFKDCLWNIAGRPWAYGDPFKWRLLYDANKSKLRDPNNPDLIEPGMVLSIPSLKDEVRQGAWDENKAYEPIN